jgi:hypothetical protein
MRFKRIVDSDAPPVLVREGVVGKRFLDRRSDKLDRIGKARPSFSITDDVENNSRN